jgi:hypothetical protein
MTHSFIPFIVSAAGLALGLAATLFLILNVKREMRHERKRIEGMLHRLRDASREPPLSVPVILGSRLGSRVNINRRTRAVELLRAGEDSVRVAADLGIPRGEVELLVRVEEIVAHRKAQAAGE